MICSGMQPRSKTKRSRTCVGSISHTVADQVVPGDALWNLSFPSQESVHDGWKTRLNRMPLWCVFHARTDVLPSTSVAARIYFPVGRPPLNCPVVAIDTSKTSALVPSMFSVARFKPCRKPPKNDPNCASSILCAAKILDSNAFFLGISLASFMGSHERAANIVTIYCNSFILHSPYYRFIYFFPKSIKVSLKKKKKIPPGWIYFQ